MHTVTYLNVWMQTKLAYASTCKHTLAYVEMSPACVAIMCQRMLAYAGICWHVPTYAKHMPYASICWHMLAIC